MKMSLDARELADLEEMSDADLAGLVRGILKKFRAKRDTEAEDDIPDADPSSAGHGGRSESTLETPASQRAGTLRATEDAALAALDRQSAQDERDAEAESIIKGYRRL